MSRSAKLTLAAGLLGLGLVLQWVSMLIRPAENMTLDWVVLAVMVVATTGSTVNAIQARRSDRARDGDRS